MKLKFMAFVILMSLFACGEEDSEYGTVDSNPASGNKGASHSKVSAEEQQSPDSGQESASNETCLFDCKTEAIAKLSFGVPLHVTDSTCSWSDFVAVPLVDGFGVLAWGDCKEGKQVYYFQLDQAGTFQGPLRVLSTQCYKFFYEVSGFAAASDDQNIMFSYACRPKPVYGISTATAYVGAFNIATGKISTHNKFFTDDSSSSSDFRMNIAFNPEAKAFGLTLRNNFYRFNSNGEQLGGSVNTYLSGSTLQLQSLAGQWYIFSNNISWNSQSCSKINSTGNLECDRKSIGRPNVFLTSTSRILSSSPSSSSSFNTVFEISSFNTDTCSMSPPQTLGRDNIDKNDVILYTLPLTQDSHAFLYKDSKTGSLKISVFKNSLTGRLLSIVSVAPSVDVMRSFAMIRNSVIYVLFLDKLGLHLSTSSIVLNEGR